MKTDFQKWINEVESEPLGGELHREAAAWMHMSEGLDLDSSGREDREFPWIVHAR